MMACYVNNIIEIYHLPSSSVVGYKPVTDQKSKVYIFVFQCLSSLFLKQLSDGAQTISSGRLFHSNTTRWLK